MARSELVRFGPLSLRVLSFGRSRRDEPDVLLIPGITSPAAVWDFVAEPLAGGRAVHVLDLRGRGQSDAAPAGAYGLQDYAADAATAIAQLDLVRPVIVGHSLGARIAAELELREGPALAARWVLVDPPLSGPGRPPYPFALDFYLDGIRAARTGDIRARVRADHPSWDESQVEARAQWLGTCDEKAIAETHRNLHTEDFVGRWQRLSAPVLISGADSPVVPPSAVAELLSLNPAARSIVVPGAGHMVPWDDPDGFQSALAQALDQSTDNEVTANA
jgi:N-formylmaleamate deformylase